MTMDKQKKRQETPKNKKPANKSDDSLLQQRPSWVKAVISKRRELLKIVPNAAVAETIPKSQQEAADMIIQLEERINRAKRKKTVQDGQSSDQSNDDGQVTTGQSRLYQELMAKFDQSRQEMLAQNAQLQEALAKVSVS